MLTTATYPAVRSVAARVAAQHGAALLQVDLGEPLVALAAAWPRCCSSSTTTSSDNTSSSFDSDAGGGKFDAAAAATASAAADDEVVRRFDAALAAGRGRVRLAIIDHVVSAPPVHLPVARLCALCALCASWGVATLVDGAHAGGGGGGGVEECVWGVTLVGSLLRQQV